MFNPENMKTNKTENVLTTKIMLHFSLNDEEDADYQGVLTAPSPRIHIHKNMNAWFKVWSQEDTRGRHRLHSNEAVTSSAGLHVRSSVV